MRFLLKILKISSITAAAVLLILVSVSLLLGNQVVDIFLASLNRQISTTLLVNESRLSLISRFPNAAVELKGITVFSSREFDKTQFRNIQTDTLLSAASATIEFGMIDMIRGNYSIENIRITSGRLNLFSDSSGMVNYEITEDDPSAEGEDFVLNFNKIIASDISSRYINKATSLDISGIIDNGRIKTRIAGENIDFICAGSLIIKKFDLLNTSVNANASIDIDVNLSQSDSGIVFRKGNMKLEDFRFSITGTISTDDMMDLKITGRNIDLARAKKYLPGEYADKFDEYSPSGIIKTECFVNGLMSRMVNPGIILSLSMENGSILHSKSNISIKDLSFNGTYSNGRLRKPESNLLDLKDLEFKIGSATWRGVLRLSNFLKPQLALTFSGDIILSEILQFFPVEELKGSEGSFRLNLKLSGSPEKKDKYSLSDLVSLNPEAVVDLYSFGISHRDDDYSVSDVTGNIMLAKNLWADDLLFTYKGQRFKVDGEFTNLPAWLAGRPVKIKAVADVSAGDFNPSVFFADSTETDENRERAFELPSGVDADINFRADNLVYKNFHAVNLEGRLVYKPGIVEFINLRINALNGNATGDFLLGGNPSKSFIARGKFKFNDADVNLAFKAFNNFGQGFIRAENLYGSVSGEVSLLIPMDSLLNPVVQSIAAEGNYIIENGKLVDFEPVKALSGFIELSELEEISFSRLENELLIRNNYVAIPLMEIRSTAADFTVSGKHSFDYTYEYHVKTALSEILSKKARQKQRTADEFGAIEEDGLGRTSIYLKITGDDKDTKVVYDLKAARSNVKQNLKNEKSSIRSILNQEYGWFRDDTTVTKTETAPKPRFRIQFSETDSTEVEKDTSIPEEEKGIKSIFKKKKSGSIN